MSMHRSLKGSNQIRVKRNVVKRHERVDKLIEDGRWNKGQKVYGLPKGPQTD